MCSEGPALRFRTGAAETVGPGDEWLRIDIIGLDGEGKTVAVAAENQVHLLDLESKQEKGLLVGDVPLEFVTLSSNGKWCAASGVRAKAAYVFDAETHERKQVLPAEQVTSLAFSPDNRWLAVTHLLPNIRLRSEPRSDSVESDFAVTVQRRATWKRSSGKGSLNPNQERCDPVPFQDVYPGS